MKSVNHRFLEIVVRLPREWSFIEDRLRRLIQSRLKRGRIEVGVTVERTAGLARQAAIDWALAEAYVEAARQVEERFGFPAGSRLAVSELLAVPGVFSLSESAPPEGAEDALMACAEEALAHVTAMRSAEGRFMAEDAARKLSGIEALIRRMAELAPTVAAEYRERLRAKLEQLLGGDAPVDEDRLSTEVVFFAERSGIDEELTRLASHTEQFAAMLDSEEPAGRKLDFLLQEMNREANTIGSKANHAALSAAVVALKAELEKLREQVQNFE